jgi:hypothetical protein
MVLSIALIFALVLLAILVLVPISIALVKDLLGLLVDRLNHYSSTKPRWVAYYLLAVVVFLVLVVVLG